MKLLMTALMTATVMALLTAPAMAQAAGPQPELWPDQVQIDSGRDAQRIIVMTRDAAGVAIDCTKTAQLSLSESGIAEIVRKNGQVFLRGQQDGDVELLAMVDGRRVSTPVKVRGAGARPGISFRNEVIPALTRAGCNSGSCHGAASGKNGFALTLFGYNPGSDHRMMTRELRGRRLDFAAPERSLMLQKATAGVTHQGGKRLEATGELYATIHEWIETGAVDDGSEAPALLGIEVLPRDVVIVGTEQHQQFLVVARYADGTDRDVTDIALWSSNNASTALVDDAGKVITGRRGEAVLLARFGGKAAVAHLLVHENDAPFTWPEDVKDRNFVDRHVHDKLKRARVQPAAPCDDSTFVRRVYLDLLGVLPTTTEVRGFLADASTDKRDKLIDALIERPEFAAVQAMTWAEVLQVDERTMGRKGASLLGRWLREAFEERRGFDDVVRDLLCSEGKTYSNPAANFHMVSRQPHLVAERAAQVFLGVRMQCAQCHNHPFERWTMDDYYGFAAFFGQTGRKRGIDPDEWIVWDRRSGSVRNRRDNAVAEPRLLGAGLAQIRRGTDRRKALADWLVTGDNPFFARNVSNRVFARLLGRGLVEPVDDVRVGNPPSHPELLDELAQLLVANDFDVRPVAAAICKSNTYQRTRQGDAPAALLAGYEPRRLSAEPLLDAIAAVTQVPTKYPGLPLGSAASAIDSGRSGIGFLAAFGRPDRTSACTCDRSDAPTLGQTLHLINGSTISSKVANGNSRLRKALAAKAEPTAMLDDLFLAAYCRMPRADERERLLAVVTEAGDKDKTAAWDDIYWSVLNSKEFLFQH